jgi:hypothetical protein
MALGRPIRGQIGKRISLDESDRDFYRFSLPSDRVLRIEVTGIPDMDLKLVVFDRAGQKVAESDSGGPGDSELLPNLGLAAGEYYLDVREEWISGKQATENISDWYTLTATAAPPSPGVEREPDDSGNTALPLELDRPITGYLSSAGDVDYYVLQRSGSEALVGEVTGINGVDLRVVVLPPGSRSGPPGPLLPTAIVFDRQPMGGGERFELRAPGSEGSAGDHTNDGVIVVIERKERKDEKAHALVLGRDQPYTLNVRVKH